MSRSVRATRCTAVLTTLAAGVLGALVWAGPAQAAGVTVGAGVSVGATPDGADDFVWPVAPGNGPGDGSRVPDDFVWPAPGDGSQVPDDFVWPVAPGNGPGDGSQAPDDFVWPASL